MEEGGEEGLVTERTETSELTGVTSRDWAGSVAGELMSADECSSSFAPSFAASTHVEMSTQRTYTKKTVRSSSTSGLHRSMQRSQFGRQVDSNKHTAPAYGFGTSNRFGKGGQFGSAIPADEVPGPGAYGNKTSLGRMEDSEKRTPANFSFGSEMRFRHIGSEPPYTPAPGVYTMPAMSGPQCLSTKESWPPKSFGTALRSTHVSLGRGFDEVLYGLQTPGAGTYSTQSMLGPQADAGRQSSPQFHFSRNARSVGGGWNSEERRSSELPGPGEYDERSSIGPQANSLKVSKPLYTLRPKWPKAREYDTGPGPGSYSTKYDSSLGPQSVSPKRNRPSFGFSLATRFPRNTGDLSPGPGSYCN